MKRIIGFMAMIAVVVLVAGLIGCAGAEREPASGKKPTAAPGSLVLEFFNDSMTQDEHGFIMVTGTAKNVGNFNITYAEVKVEFYDAEGALLDTSTEVITNILTGESCDFKVRYYGEGGEKIKSYKIGTGYMN